MNVAVVAEPCRMPEKKPCLAWRTVTVRSVFRFHLQILQAPGEERIPTFCTSDRNMQMSKTCPKLSETINRIYHENETPTRCFFSEIKDEALKLGANAVPKLKTGTMEWGQPQSLYKKGRHVKAVSKIRLIRTYQSLKQHERLLRLF